MSTMDETLNFEAEYDYLTDPNNWRGDRIETHCPDCGYEGCSPACLPNQVAAMKEGQR